MEGCPVDEREATELLERLKNGDIEELRVKREDFLIFRNVLTRRNDFKHFRGIAQKGGDIIYHYMEKPRS
ncbi:MAG: hypothetical protein FWJ66_08925 [Caldibacillus sp.]